MDKGTRGYVKNPRENANFLSVITFSWLLKTFALGYKRDLEETDLYSPLKEHTSSILGDKIVKVWDRAVAQYKKNKKSSSPSLIKIIAICFGKHIVLLGLVQAFMECVICIFQPVFLARLLSCLRIHRQERGNEVYYYSAAFMLCLVLNCFVLHGSLQGLLHMGMKVRVAVCSLIYRKILKLSTSVLENETSVGQIVNFLSADVNRLDYGIYDCNYIWIGPTQMIIISSIVYYEVGWSGIFGMLTFLIFIPLQLCIGKRISRLMYVSTARTDTRLRLMNEVIGGVQIIKMYVWEVPFSRLVEHARRKEVNAITKYLNLEAMATSTDYYLPRLSIFITLITYVTLGNYIDAEKVFMITAFYTALRRSMTIGFTFGTNHLFEALVTIRRFEKFLTYDEFTGTEEFRGTEQTKETIITNLGEPATFAICLDHASAKWNDGISDDTLSDVSLRVEPGNFVAIVGQIGSGKSSLLHALLGELPLSSGTLRRSGKIAYVSQQPWIFASSVRQNIVFGQPMDKSRYDEVIKVCQLQQDMVSFLHGDETIVGEKGISLSGGQRARINLARAVYANADIYLLDDPLSAVDARVGRKIVDECVRGYLKDKTTILVTHQLQYLRNDDRVIVMNNGRIEIDGTLERLRASGKIFAGILENSTEVEGEGELGKIRKRQLSVDGENKVANGNTPLEVAEMRTMGRISSKVYLSYFQACKSVCAIMIMIFLTILTQGVQSGADYFVAYWVNAEEESVTNRNDTVGIVWRGPFTRETIMYIYTGMVIVMILSCIFHILSFIHVCMRSSKNLHAGMFRSMIRTTMHFFNENPMGRILNRFSKDMSAIDTKLPLCIVDVLLIFTNLLIFLIIVGSVNAWLLVPLAIAGVFFYFLRIVYIAVSRSVKRLEGTTRSPVFDHVGATLQGLATIRAFKAQRILTKEFDNHQDLHSSAWFIFFSSSRAFGVFIEFSCILCTGTIILAFLFLEDVIKVGNVGLVITQIIQMGWLLQWGIRQTAEMENQMTSVERVLEYSKLEEEPFLEGKPESKPPDDWPVNGLVEFREVYLKYSVKSNYVLKGVTFTVMPKEKIGIVGRTGAGKTSLISALFRLAIVEGEILIDGISTGKIGLHDFRSKISIIPQEPILFAGDLRKNLDPFDEYSDDLLWQALADVELKETIAEMPAGLNSKVSEGGVNFSVGQRQLLCLARAIVRKNKIMVLDEATANVDHQTDSLIQKTVRKKFKDCSVLTVAHRLNTVMDSDKILVMDAGRLVEFDHPYILLQRRGHFYGMVEQTGRAMAATLTEIAEKCYYEERREVPS